MGEVEDVLEVAQIWKGVEGKFNLFQMAETTFNLYVVVVENVYMIGDRVVLGFNIAVFTGGELGKSKKWRMQGVASKTSRTTADMEKLAQQHVWYCNASTTQRCCQHVCVRVHVYFVFVQEC